MNLIDSIKKTMEEGFFSNVLIENIIVCLGIATMIGIFIYFVYRFKNHSELYSKDFNVVLVGLPIITSAIVLSMQSNLVLSLGMVGALSIVRFRNAVKSSLDLLFLFWSISIGIICGVNLYFLAIVLSIVMTIVLMIFDLLPNKSGYYLLVINYHNLDIDDKIIDTLKQYSKHYKIKSKSIHNNGADLIIEVKTKKADIMLKELNKIKNIGNINLLSNDGDIRL